MIALYIIIKAVDIGIYILCINLWIDVSAFTCVFILLHEFATHVVQWYTVWHVLDWKSYLIWGTNSLRLL